MPENISNLIVQFSNKFLTETQEPYQATDNTRIITEIIPNLLKEGLRLGANYKVYGSAGSGNWSEIPWVGILDESITTSTTKGYYVVLLLDKSMQNIHLALAVGWKQFEEEFGIKEGKIKIMETCEYYAKLLDKNLVGFKEGKIDLGAENTLGKGYEKGAILSKKYAIAQLNDEILLNDIEKLLEKYQELKNTVGDSILNLEIDFSRYDETLIDFKKKVAIASLNENPDESITQLIEEANNAPPEIRTKLKKEIVRNRKFAEIIKKRANYICEVCGISPFIQRNGKPYAEADHIIPLGGDSKGLDNPNNMRCLCAQCHAVITHGSEEVIKTLLEKNTQVGAPGIHPFNSPLPSAN